MQYQVTIRLGGRAQRYHTFSVSAPDAATALREAANEIPPEMAEAVDLVELRIAVDPEHRTYLGDETAT